VLTAQPAVYAVPVIAAAVENRADYLVDVLEPENPPRLFVTAQTFMRKVPALVAVTPAAAYVFAQNAVTPIY